MIEQEQRKNSDGSRATRRRQVGIAAFLVGLTATLAFFGFFPGLPHVIDWGAILVAVAVGAVARWARQAWMTKAAQRKPERL